MCTFGFSFLIVAQGGSEEWLEKQSYSIQQIYRAAFNSEKAGKHKDAAEFFESLKIILEDSDKKVIALFHQATNTYMMGKRYKAFKLFRNLIESYPTFSRMDNVIKYMGLIGDSYYEEKARFFTGASLEKAYEVYEFIKKYAPYGKGTAQKILRLAHIAEEQYSYDVAIQNYKLILNNAPKSSSAPEACYQLANLYTKRSGIADADGQLSKKAVHYLRSFKENYPQSKYQEKASQILASFDDKKALRLLKLGEFYLRDAHKKVPAARRYLHRILKEHKRSTIAEKAEYILAHIDKKGLLKEIEQAKKQKKRKKEKNVTPPYYQTIKPKTFSNLPDYDKEKWLIPLENLNEKK